MPVISHSEICAAPLEVTFAYLDDYRNVLDYWHGMTSYQPVGEPHQGIGSVFEAVSKVGPSTVKSTVKTVHWEKDTRVSYKSIAGMDTATTFTFAAVDATHSRVEFSIEFHLPGGIAGRAMEKTLEPFVQTAAKKTAENIARVVSAHYAAASAESVESAESAVSAQGAPEAS